ncbi:hypothetical protein [Fredinandcohnia sp. 179-A 10B2 NHS]|uniref:hypothetical protein n=1 Tax=Fredinandcohnia sp. 179-A 10B2 NHS TaxID=3235176 RepID=UPI0039A11FDA
MKKILLLLMIISFVFAGCSNEITSTEKSDAVLKPIQQSEDHMNLIGSLGLDTLLMYDVEIKDEDLKMIHYWVEHYKSGKKQDDLVRAATTLNKEDVTFAFSKINLSINETDTYERWNLSVSDGTSLSSAESLPIKTFPEEIGEAKSWISEKTKITAEKPVAVSLIIKDGSNGIGVGLDDEVIERTIEQSEEVYIVKVMVSKSEDFE